MSYLVCVPCDKNSFFSFSFHRVWNSLRATIFWTVYIMIWILKMIVDQINWTKNWRIEIFEFSIRKNTKYFYFSTKFIFLLFFVIFRVKFRLDKKHFFGTIVDFIESHKNLIFPFFVFFISFWKRILIQKSNLISISYPKIIFIWHYIFMLYACIITLPFW